jgi:hypothetical protein
MDHSKKGKKVSAGEILNYRYEAFSNIHMLQELTHGEGRALVSCPRRCSILDPIPQGSTQGKHPIALYSTWGLLFLHRSFLKK